jgi:nucleoside-diphosphate-sugar epimerase
MMKGTVLVTGSEGLIGRALVQVLEGWGCRVRRLDLRLPFGHEGKVDVRSEAAVRAAVSGCRGVVHLAAVSRVIWGEWDPALCRLVNEGGTANVLRAASASGAWVLFGSSREVYGEPAELPVKEDAPLVHVNVYGKTKIAGEELTTGARASGIKTGVVRFSNVYGDAFDHADRVTPAFARAAATGAPLRLDGSDHVFDFTHVHEVARGAALAAAVLDSGENLPPIHFVTGRGTEMRALADLCVTAGGRGSRVEAGTPRSYDVGRFVGDPSRAERLLGWRASVMPEHGVPALVADYARMPRKVA